MIDAYLKADRKRLAAIKDGPPAKLASLLSLMIVEYPAIHACWSRRRTTS